jgi:hypothetical protein
MAAGARRGERAARPARSSGGLVSQATVSAPAVRFPALRIPEFRAYWVTSTVAMLADNIEHVVGYWLLWELTHSPFWLGYALFAHWFPFVLVSLHAGAWADRFDNRRLLQVTQVFYVMCSGGIGILYVMGQLQLWHMIVILLLHGFSGVIKMPSSQVLIYDVVGKDELPNALSLATGSRYVAQFLGPMIGGLFLATLGPGWGLLANVLLYAPLTLVQALSPGDMRGRVVGVYSMAVFGPRVISGLALGALATALGAHPALGLMALVIVVAVGALIATVPAVRELD